MIENTSGHGAFAEVPDEVNKWNWGAFWLTWIWGIGNKTYIALLALLPIANIIMPFYLGKKGNELAWRNTYWYDVEDLHKTQKKWAIAGWIISLLLISAFIRIEVEKYLATKQSNRIADEVMEIIMEHSEAKTVVGNDYDIISKGTQGVSLSNKDIIVGHQIILRNDDDVYLIYSSINEDKQITQIKISRFGDDEESDIIIMLK